MEQAIAGGILLALFYIAVGAVLISVGFAIIGWVVDHFWIFVGIVLIVGVGLYTFIQGSEAFWVNVWPVASALGIVAGGLGALWLVTALLVHGGALLWKQLRAPGEEPAKPQDPWAPRRYTDAELKAAMDATVAAHKGTRRTAQSAMGPKEA